MSESDDAIAYAAAHIGGHRLVITVYTAGPGKAINRPTDWVLIADSVDQLVAGLRECLAASEAHRPPREFGDFRSATLTWEQKLQELGRTKGSVRSLPWLTMEIRHLTGDHEVAATIFDKTGFPKHEVEVVVPGPHPSDEAIQAAIDTVLDGVRAAAGNED
ncbi:hypothetical protein [Arthrobacter sp. 2MCAF14]|uniref:hypothetical protein n=1 Tax=Arthrobacter sp. 2MCAF14 TaxID=3232982 RepID=UPI003F8F6EA8